MDLASIKELVEGKEKCGQCHKLYDSVTEMFVEVTKHDRCKTVRHKEVEILNLIKQMSMDRNCSSCDVVHCMARSLFEQVL